MESFANALRQLPSIIAENGGYDSAELVSELKALHATGKQTMGLDMYQVLTNRFGYSKQRIVVDSKCGFI